MINRPDKVRIGSFDFDVIWEGQAFERSARSVAQIDCHLYTIRIAETSQSYSLACRFLHEIIHGIIFYQENCHDDSMREEDCCNVGSYGIVDFWRSNPEVFKWWISLINPNIIKE